MEDARQSGALPSLSEASDVHAPRALHSTPREAGARQLTFLAPASLMHKLVFSSAPASHVHMPALAPHLPTLCTLEAASAAHPRCYPTCAQHAPMSPAEGLDPGRRWSAPRSAAAHRCQLLPRLSSCTTKSCSPQVYFFVCFFAHSRCGGRLSNDTMCMIRKFPTTMAALSSSAPLSAPAKDLQLHEEVVLTSNT